MIKKIIINMENKKIFKVTKVKRRNTYATICAKQYDFILENYYFISPNEVTQDDFKTDKNGCFYLKNNKEINIFNYSKYIKKNVLLNKKV